MGQQFVSIPVANLGPQFSRVRAPRTEDFGYHYLGVGGPKGLKGGGFSWPGEQHFEPTPPPDLSDLIKTNQGQANIPAPEKPSRGDQFKVGQGDLEEHAAPAKAVGVGEEIAADVAEAAL